MSRSASNLGSASFALFLTMILMSACGVQGLSVHQIAPAQVLQINPPPQPTPVIPTPQYDIAVSFLDNSGTLIIPESVHYYLQDTGEDMSDTGTGIVVHNRTYIPGRSMMSLASLTFPKMESCPVNLLLGFSDWTIDPATNVANHLLTMSISAFSVIGGSFIKTDFKEDPLKSMPGPQVLGTFFACTALITAQFQRLPVQTDSHSGGQ